MKTEFNYDKINRLLSDFYAVTGQRIGLFDVNFKILNEYPKQHSPFCAYIRSTPEGARRCHNCDLYGMREATNKGKTITYRCHAGLLEVCSPINDKKGLSGFLMFGQVLYDRNFEKQISEVKRLCSDIALDSFMFSDLLKSIRKTPADYLNSAASIMTACVGYIQLEQLMEFINEDLWGRILYIEKQADRPLTLEEMAFDLSVSVSTLCKTAKKRCGKTVIQLITDQRIKHAKLLLSEKSRSISEIASLVGIDDYNYFSRLFKKETGFSPTGFRKSL